MGSSFFSKGFQGIDPIGQLVGKISGPNSWFARMSSYDPIVSSGAGKFIAPASHNVGVQYSQRHTDMNPTATAANYPTPYANVTPTLADANSQYVKAAQAQAQQKAQQQQPGQATPYGYTGY